MGFDRSPTGKVLKRLLKFNDKICWAFLGVRTIDFIDISFLIPVEFILTGDYGKEIRLFRRHRKVFSLEKQKTPFARKDWTIESYDTNLSGRLHEEFVQCLLQRLGNYDRICFFCFGSPRVLERVQAQLGRKVEILSPPAELRKVFSNKVLQYASFRKLGLPVPLTDSVRLRNETYTNLSSKFGNRFVVHLSHSDSGSGTFVCYKCQDLEMLKERFPKAKALISSFLEGLSLNMHAVVIDFHNRLEVVASQPSVQLVGTKGLVRRETIWAGNDFASAHEILDRASVEKMIEEMEKIGKWMGSMGWRGIFGVDFVRDSSHKIFPLDINARFQGSTQVLTEACLHSGLVPLTVLHILQFLRCPVPSDLVNKIRAQSFLPIPGALLVPHNLIPRRQKIRRKLEPGVYSLDNRKITFRRDGYRLSHCCDHDKKEFVITSGVPRKDTYVDIDCPIFEMQTWRRVVGESGKELNCWGKTMVNFISSLICE